MLSSRQPIWPTPGRTTPPSPADASHAAWAVLTGPDGPSNQPSRPAFSLFPWVLDLASVHDGDRVLEVGCGNGGYLALVEAIGMDISVGMLHAARDRTSAALICGDAQRLPFQNESFDVVLAPHMLYHVADRRAAIQELRRVLKRSGTCVAVTNSARCLRSWAIATTRTP